MMNNKIKQLRAVFNKWKENSMEENIRVHVILNSFLPLMGYETSDCELEKGIGKGFCDMFVPIKDRTTLLIEVKNPKHSLTNNDIDQVKAYATNKGQEYAILTNGKEYILLNFKIESRPVISGDVLESHIVFWFDIFKDKGKGVTELKYFDYLSYEKLFISGTTNFFTDITQYKIWKFEEGMLIPSWMAYQSTLYNFYDFISNRYSKYHGTYLRMSEDDFEEFILTRKRNGSKTSIKTVGNNHTHIFDMLFYMKKHGRIPHINFEENRNKSLENFLNTEDKKTLIRLNKQDISRTIEMYSCKRNATRNIIIYLMCATLGMERSEVLNIKWEDFDKNFKYINVHGRKIELHDMLKGYLKQFQEEQRRKKGYLFVTLYQGKYKRINESTINDIFNEFKKEDKNGEVYSPKYLKGCLIISMFYDGYSLEDIMYITDFDMSNLERYITKDMIFERRKGKFNWKKLYEGILCN